MRILALILMLLASGVGIACQPITVDKLVGNEDYYHGKDVVITGVVHFEFEMQYIAGENTRIWINMYSPPPYTKESINRDEARIKNYKKLYQDKKVILTGRFNKDNTGHMGMWPAGIDEVYRIYRNAKNIDLKY